MSKSAARRITASTAPPEQEIAAVVRCASVDASAAKLAAEQSYRRARDLPKLVALWPHEIEDTSDAATARLLGKLRRALRNERQRGLSGHWAYDLARHVQLLRAYRAETAAHIRTASTSKPR